MAMSRDRVRFILASRYFNGSRTRNPTNCMDRDICKRVLQKSFDMTFAESDQHMQDNPNGFTIICRPSQFARFIVHRHDMGQCINGIRDLHPELINEHDIYDQIAKEAQVSRTIVKQVLNATKAIALPALPIKWTYNDKSVIDVSSRPHQECY